MGFFFALGVNNFSVEAKQLVPVEFLGRFRHVVLLVVHGLLDVFLYSLRTFLFGLFILTPK